MAKPCNGIEAHSTNLTACYANISESQVNFFQEFSYYKTVKRNSNYTQLVTTGLDADQCVIGKHK